MQKRQHATTHLVKEALDLDIVVSVLAVHALLLVDRLFPTGEHGRFGSFLKVRADFGAVAASLVIKIIGVETSTLLFCSSRHRAFPFTTHFLNLLLVIKIGIVVLSNTTKTFPQRKMLGVDSNTVVVLLTTSAEISPAALLLLEIKSSGIWQEENGENDTS